MTMFCEPALQQWQKIVPHPYFGGQIHPPKCLINDFICISVMCRFTNLRKKIKTLHCLSFMEAIALVASVKLQIFHVTGNLSDRWTLFVIWKDTRQLKVILEVSIL